MNNICIGVITYKRPIGLKHLLNALKTQELDNIKLSVIVVDNDATGENKKVIDAIEHSLPYDVSLYVEKTRGIVAARNRVVTEFLKTDNEALIFIDDDEWPVNSNWIKKLLEVYIKYDADIVYSDALVIPESDDISWINKAFRINKMKAEITPIQKFFTNNLWITRHVLEKLNPPFDQRFAMTGSSDLHFSIKVNNFGFKAYYTPFAPVEEVFHKSRANYKWFFLRGYRVGEGSTRANIYEGSSPLKYLYIPYMSLGRLFKSILNFIKSVFTLDKGYLAASITYLGAAIGTITGLFGLTYDEYNTTHGK